MQVALTPADQLQLGAFVLPVIAIVVNFAINSVEKDDPWVYRYIVGTLGIASIAPATVVLGLAVAGGVIGIVVGDIFGYLVFSLFSAVLLTLIVLVYEVFRGLSAEDDARKLSYALLGSTVAISVFLRFAL